MFRYIPGYRYEVFVGNERVLLTSHAGRTPITNAVRSNIGKILDGQAIRIVPEFGPVVLIEATTEPVECANCDEVFVPGPEATADNRAYCSPHCQNAHRGDRCPQPCTDCEDNEV